MRIMALMLGQIVWYQVARRSARRKISETWLAVLSVCVCVSAHVYSARYIGNCQAPLRSRRVYNDVNYLRRECPATITFSAYSFFFLLLLLLLLLFKKDFRLSRLAFFHHHRMCSLYASPSKRRSRTYWVSCQNISLATTRESKKEAHWNANR